MIIYRVCFENEKYSGEHCEYNVSARSIQEAERKAIRIADKNKDIMKTGRFTRSVELVVETDD